MRVLIAFDGSASSGTAVELAGALAWPAGSVIRIVQVVRALPAPGPIVRGNESAQLSLDDAAGRLRRDGVTVEPLLAQGDRAAEAIVLQARQLPADLVIVGHRGHGAMATIFLGSVARDVAEKAPCPVLIARGGTCDRVVFAEDGSESAYQARRVLTSWPIFLSKQVRVVTVVQVAQPLLAGIGSAVRGASTDAQKDVEMEARVAYGRLATEATEELRIAGLAATGEVRNGDPADEIAAAARESRADLIVMGTRGRGPMTRVMLGSAARAIVLSAPCSVLVARSA